MNLPSGYATWTVEQQRDYLGHRLTVIEHRLNHELQQSAFLRERLSSLERLVTEARRFVENPCRVS